MPKKTIKKYPISPTGLAEAIARLKPETRSARELTMLVRQQIEERVNAGVPLEQIAALMTNTFSVEINAATLRRYLNGMPTQQDKQIAHQLGAEAGAAVGQSLPPKPANSDSAAKKKAS
jgi:hypothetical protein